MSPRIEDDRRERLHQVFREGFFGLVSPRGRRIEIGDIWKTKNQNGGDYLSLSVNTGHGRLNANLGRLPGQDDEDLMAVIPWE